MCCELHYNKYISHRCWHKEVWRSYMYRLISAPIWIAKYFRHVIWKIDYSHGIWRIDYRHGNRRIDYRHCIWRIVYRHGIWRIDCRHVTEESIIDIVSEESFIGMVTEESISLRPVWTRLFLLFLFWMHTTLQFINYL